MGLFDNDVEDSFDSLFDMDRDGKLDSSEENLKMEFIDDCLKSDSGSDDDDFDEDDDDI